MTTNRRVAVKQLGLLLGLSFVNPLKWFSFEKAIDEGNISGRQAPSGIRAVIIGTGSRGNRFGKYALVHPENVKIVGLAELIAERRQTFASRHDIPLNRQWQDWKGLFSLPKFADVVIITGTGDYSVPCAEAIRAGYEVWMDKPVSCRGKTCRAIADLARRYNQRVYTCHVIDQQLHFQSV